MAEQKLNLLKFAAGRPAQASARSTQIVGCEMSHSRLRGEFLDDMPSEFLGYSVSPRIAGTAHAPEYLSALDSCRFDPTAEFAINPIRNRHCPDVTSLAAQVNDRPMSLTLLQMIEGQCGHLVTPETTGKKDGQERSVALALEPVPVRSLPECGPLLGSQPVSQPDTQSLYALHTPDSRREVGAEESAVCGFVRQAANRAQPEVEP